MITLKMLVVWGSRGENVGLNRNEGPVLLCTMGTSWAVVAEAAAFPLPRGEHFSLVAVITSAGTADAVANLRRYWQRNGRGRLEVFIVKDFVTLNTTEEHLQFTEALYRWILAVAPDPDTRYVCLAGGFKTMSSAMYQAAVLFGAAEVFHVLATPRYGPSGSTEPATEEEVVAALRASDVRYVRLLPQRGWPQFAGLRWEDFPLKRAQEGENWLIWAEGAGLQQHVEEVVRRLQSPDKDLEQLPFRSLALWPQPDRSWLQEPLDPVADLEWLRKLPKVELHCHLGGFATSGKLLEQVRQAAEDPGTLPALKEIRFPEGWPKPKQAIKLDHYMALGNNNGTALLRDRGCLKKQCELLYQALVEDHVRYAEIRCSPANYAFGRRSPWDVLVDIREAFQQAMDNCPEQLRCHVNLILIATRREGEDRSAISRHLALAVVARDHWQDGCRVVGVDLAGFESVQTRAALFEADFTPAHRVGLAVTVHAGENDDVESVWQAVFRLSARRLGHALNLEEAPDLLRAVADRGIGVEMCPYANLQIKGYALGGEQEGKKRYPLRRYLEQGVLVTVNTDNIGISQASLSQNLALLAELCPGITRLEILRLLANAASVAFLPVAKRQQLREELAKLPRPFSGSHRVVG